MADLLDWLIIYCYFFFTKYEIRTYFFLNKNVCTFPLNVMCIQAVNLLSAPKEFSMRFLFSALRILPTEINTLFSLLIFLRKWKESYFYDDYTNGSKIKRTKQEKLLLESSIYILFILLISCEWFLEPTTVRDHELKGIRFESWRIQKNIV